VFYPKNSNVSVNLSFFLAGASTLIFQLAWMRAIQRYVGIALPTVALITAIFMIGLLVGGLVARRFADGAKQPLKFYSLGQAILAGAGLTYFLFHSQLYALVERIATPNSALLNATEFFRITVISAALLMPTICMGAAFPLIAKALSENGAQRDRFVYAYGANLIGGCLGALVCGFLLLPHFGVAISSCVGAVLSLVAALIVVSQWHRSDEIAPKQEKLPPINRGTMIVPAVLSGFAIFLLELLWTRFLFLVVGGSTYALALTLSWQLIALALASAMVSNNLRLPQLPKFWLPWKPLLPERSQQVISAGAALAGISIIFSCYSFLSAPIELVQLERLWLSVFPDYYFGAFFSSRVLMTGFYVFPPAFFLGFIFPVVLSNLNAERANYSSQVATLYIVNTMGAVVACAFGGAILVPVLSKFGPHPFMIAFEVLAVILLTFSILQEHRLFSPKYYLLVASVVLMMLLPPLWPTVGAACLSATEETISYLLEGLNPKHEDKILYYNEGINSIVSVVKNPANNIISLQCDGKIEAALPDDITLPAPTSDQATHIMLGYIPTLIPPRTPQDALLIGLGSGLTADAILDSPYVRSLTVAELEKDTLDASSFFKSNFKNRDAFKSGRAKFVASDGRNYLSLLTRQYDVIVSQPDEPYVNGMSDLYTAEFWHLARSRIREGGVFAQWIQLYAVSDTSLKRMLSTFVSVFPKSLVFMPENAAEIIVVGFNLPPAKQVALDQFDNSKNLFTDQYKFELPRYPDLCIDFNRFVENFRKPQCLTRLAQLEIAEPEDFLSTLKMAKGDFSMFEGGESRGLEIYTDDTLMPESALSTKRLLSGKPITEYLSNMFQRMPSKVDASFTNIGTVKRDVTDFYHEMNFRYLNLFGKNRAALTSDNFSDSLLFARRAQRFNATAIGIIMPAMVFYGFGLPLPRSLIGQLPASPLGLTNSEDLRFYGIRYGQVGNLDQGQIAFEEAAKLSPNNIHRRDLGGWFLNHDNAAKSIPVFEEAIKVEPTAFWAWEGAGLAYATQNEAPKAEQYLRKSLSLCPSLYNARLQLGKLLCVQGRAEEGLKDIHWASMLKPQEFEPNLYVTAFYAAKLNWRKAEENLPLLERKLPGDPRVTYLATQIAHRQPLDLKVVGIKEELGPRLPHKPQP
jgi:spermidine synthase